MRTILGIYLSLLMLSICALAQPPISPAISNDALLDRLTGNWILQGTIAGRETTHDVEADRVLARHYVRLHEVSREKNAAGQPAYEAIVFIELDPASSDYTCLWLDSTAGGGLSAKTLAHARRNDDQLPFLFNIKDGSIFHTTFIYNAAADTWQWVMDDEEGGKFTPFARLTLTRKK